MIFPVVFAVVVWLLAAKFRRRWQGVASTLVAMLILTTIGATAIETSDGAVTIGGGAMPEWWIRGSKLVLVLLVPYALLVGAVAIFLLLLPRPRRSATQCGKCGYDLRGLDLRDTKCPECGAAWKGSGSLASMSEVELVPIPKHPPGRRRRPNF